MIAAIDLSDPKTLVNGAMILTAAAYAGWRYLQSRSDAPPQPKAAAIATPATAADDARFRLQFNERLHWLSEACRVRLKNPGMVKKLNEVHDSFTIEGMPPKVEGVKARSNEPK